MILKYTDSDLSAALAAELCRAVAELPDRTSPEDWPEAMLVTSDELIALVQPSISAALAKGREEAIEIAQIVYNEGAACMKIAPGDSETRTWWSHYTLAAQKIIVAIRALAHRRESRGG